MRGSRPAYCAGFIASVAGFIASAAGFMASASGFMASAAGFIALVAIGSAGFIASVAIALAGFMALVASSARAPATKTAAESAKASAGRVRYLVMEVSLGFGAQAGRVMRCR